VNTILFSNASVRPQCPCMLETLRIRNLALVTDLTLELGPGYNAISGETGAGKSILIGALNLVLGERADRLAALRTDEGYMAEVDRLGDVLLLREDHCPICVAATSCQGFCRSELRTFEAVFEGVATVSRDEHLVAGGRRCTYRIEPLSELARVTDCRPK